NSAIELGDYSEGRDTERDPDYERPLAAIKGTRKNDGVQMSDIVEKIKALPMENGLYIVSDKRLKLQLLVLAHAGLSGHRRQRATIKIVAEVISLALTPA